ncbi:CYFA0S05e00188g1_1 [Cyberlindnera fabianii]|uniref:CYFA0S05e00188g1_1 n=1 Tax=Cyberlindnera fabianii TaxID=36022 RepID=A0A061B057_CYBFA|nr:Golgi reassembly-stacking protein 2 [Cyberlindnera fabianii]CDR40385.1 CYFA0S05e00188g1_1 [Cyberlindnera fabianii]
MFSFAKNLVKTLEHTAESVISGGPQDESILESDPYFANTKHNRAGLRVLHVAAGSTAAEVGLESWFDFILGINGHELPTSYDDQYQLSVNYDYLKQEISNCKGRSVKFEVWSAKGGTLRTVEIAIKAADMDDIPLGSGAPGSTGFEKLGVKLQWTPLISATFVYHVLEIHPNSPAEKTGLIEHSDYIIGAQDGLLATGGEDLLGRLITSKKNSSLILYVYNHDYNVVRPVTITPAENWGGDGVLGCGVGYGFLHRVPPVNGEYEPGSVLFDGNYSQENFTQPAHFTVPAAAPMVPTQPSSVQQAPAAPLTSPTTGGVVPPPVHRKKKTGGGSTSADLLDYLQEESEKSRKLDTQGRSTPLDSSVPPPPPKK